MSLGRTGSTFLCSHFKNYTYNKSCKVYNANEFFRFWPMQFWRHINFLTDNNLEIPKSFVDFMTKIVRYKKADQDNQEQFKWIAPHVEAYGKQNLGKDKAKFSQDIEDGWPYSLDMIDDFCEQIARLNNPNGANSIDYFINKHISRISEINGDEWSYTNVVSKADLVIVNYRHSILDTFISLLKALESKMWASKIYDPAYDNKFEWNINHFKDFATKRYLSHYERIKEGLAKINKPHFVVEYENFSHHGTDRREYLIQKFLQTGVFDTTEVDELLIQRKQNINMIKQSKPRKFYEDCFSNPEQFKKDYHEIKHLTTYTY